MWLYYQGKSTLESLVDGITSYNRGVVLWGLDRILWSNLMCSFQTILLLHCLLSLTLLDMSSRSCPPRRPLAVNQLPFCLVRTFEEFVYCRGLSIPKQNKYFTYKICHMLCSYLPWPTYIPRGHYIPTLLRWIKKPSMVCTFLIGFELCNSRVARLPLVFELPLKDPAILRKQRNTRLMR